ncbi:alpha/beta hydrolase [Octadecabacter sp. 1_MG-2023]|uniref:alpha/beta fold hydrolase n=1 Tax=unclassified Octadecabacter TaxID=196158 RepID=UPI001C08F0D8|nr:MULTISPECIES: alpha/beta hydrolase [unclassified Octadecabacter]MDO6733134.1 alpha/beta hydrolase [Octadecabacter sp. 1_MG-2023]
MKPVYFHGVPGWHDEVTFAGVSPHALLPEEQATPDAKLIAFSLGAHRALKYAAHNGARGIVLIAPAAPLTLGDFLPHMDGAPVFRAAAKSRLGLVSFGQSLMARYAPGLLRRVLLSNAAPADLALFATKDAQVQLTALLRQSMVSRRADYVDAVIDYVQDWSPLLKDVTCPVTIFHGSADTWAPISMADALCQHLPNATLHRLRDMGHYSALAHVLPKLLN